jgi:hypothetical protein
MSRVGAKRSRCPVFAPLIERGWLAVLAPERKSKRKIRSRKRSKSKRRIKSKNVAHRPSYSES